MEICRIGMTRSVAPESLPSHRSDERQLTFPNTEGWVDSLPAATNKLRAEWQVVVALPCTEAGGRPVILQTTSQERYRVVGRPSAIFELALWVLRGAMDGAGIPCDTCTVETLLQRHVTAALRHLRREEDVLEMRPSSSHLALEDKAPLPAPIELPEAADELCFF